MLNLHKAFTIQMWSYILKPRRSTTPKTFLSTILNSGAMDWRSCRIVIQIWIPAFSKYTLISPISKFKISSKSSHFQKIEKNLQTVISCGQSVLGAWRSEWDFLHHDVLLVPFIGEHGFKIWDLLIFSPWFFPIHTSALGGGSQQWFPYFSLLTLTQCHIIDLKQHSIDHD